MAYVTTLKHALRALTGSSAVADIDAGFLALAEDIDDVMAAFAGQDDTIAHRCAHEMADVIDLAHVPGNDHEHWG